MLWSLSAALAAPTVTPTTALVPGSWSEVLVTGAAPGATVHLFGGQAGLGQGPCQGAVCLDLLQPRPLGTALADADGAASFRVGLPPATPLGPAWLQAVAAGPAVVGPVAEVRVRTPVRLLAIGDSITEGQQSNPQADPYVEVMADDLGAGWQVANLGCGGATSTDWHPASGTTLCGGLFWNPNVYEARVTPELPADLATVMLGTNDATGFFEPAPVLPRDYRANLIALTDRLLADGVATVLLMSPPPMCANTDPAIVDRLEAYRAIAADLCATRPGLVCGPDVYTLLGPADFAGCDVHPNGQGHEVLGHAVAEAVSALPPF